MLVLRLTVHWLPLDEEQVFERCPLSSASSGLPGTWRQSSFQQQGFYFLDFISNCSMWMTGSTWPSSFQQACRKFLKASVTVLCHRLNDQHWWRSELSKGALRLKKSVGSDPVCTQSVFKLPWRTILFLIRACKQNQLDGDHMTKHFFNHWPEIMRAEQSNKRKNNGSPALCNPC